MCTIWKSRSIGAPIGYTRLLRLWINVNDVHYTSQQVTTSSQQVTTSSQQVTTSCTHVPVCLLCLYCVAILPEIVHTTISKITHQSADLALFKPSRPKGFFQFEIVRFQRQIPKSILARYSEGKRNVQRKTAKYVLFIPSLLGESAIWSFSDKHLVCAYVFMRHDTDTITVTITSCQPNNVDLMLVQRRRRWNNIKSTLLVDGLLGTLYRAPWRRGGGHLNLGVHHYLDHVSLPWCAKRIWKKLISERNSMFISHLLVKNKYAGDPSYPRGSVLSFIPLK